MSNFWDDHMENDESAAGYMKSYGEGSGSETRFKIFDYINDGESILDVGCGPGWNLDHAIDYGYKPSAYKGLDYSERFVRVANKRIREEYGKDKDLFFYGDCRDLPEEDGSWDVVILQDVLEHTNGYELPLTEALRVARKRVIVTFWRGLKNDRSENDVRNSGNDGYESTYSRSSWESFLDVLGYFWVHEESSPGANRWHEFYIIDKEEKYE